MGINQSTLTDLANWFADRPSWMRDAFARLLKKGALTETDLEELVQRCKLEAGISDSSSSKAAQSPAPLPVPPASPKASLRLLSIKDPKGVNALRPQKPLELGDFSLVIVYGLNATGKSGYVRAIKQASGAPTRGELLGDVYDSKSEKPSCAFTCSVNGATKEVTWSAATGPIEELSPVQVYDREAGNVYVTQENELAYEPAVLGLLSTLTDVCGRIDAILASEIQQKPSKKPLMPAEFQGTSGFPWYGSLSASTNEASIGEKSAWTVALGEELSSLEQRLAEKDPGARANEIRKSASRVDKFADALSQRKSHLSDELCQSYLSLRKDWHTKRQAADSDAKKVFANAPLSGVGTETWKLLWVQARRYAESEAYKGLPFPNTGPDARCVLCQQSLGSEAKDRLRSFEEFVKGALEVQASEAEQKFKNTLQGLTGTTQEALNLNLDALEVRDPNDRALVLGFSDALDVRVSALALVETTSALPVLPPDDAVTMLRSRVEALVKEAGEFGEQAKAENRPKLEQHRKELAATKWLNQERQSIDAEVQRLQEIQRLEQARKLTSTQALSLKKSALAENLLTKAYVDRFQAFLKALGAARTRVRLVKSRTQKGHVFHQIVLDGCARPVAASSVLSEGEFRVVSLAAFLADVAGREDNGPIILDDPISSLDHVFEEAAANRLVGLAKTRQIIVFTHRLSLVHALVEASKAQNIEPNLLALRSEVWGFGEPSEPPTYAKKPKAALNELLQRNNAARKVQASSGQAEYEKLARGICGDLRITLEVMLETELMGDVVVRYRRSVQTLGKIKGLAKITASDCAIFDGLMTKYSKFEHSQPDEAPVPLPTPDEIEADCKALQNWSIQFEKRPIPTTASPPP